MKQTSCNLFIKSTSAPLLIIIVSVFCLLNPYSHLFSNNNSSELSDPKLRHQERKPFDPANVPLSAYLPGKLYIMINSETSNLLKDELISAERGYVVTNIAELDELNQMYAVTEYRPLLHGLYDISPKSAANRHKHLEYGFHLWFEISLQPNSDIKKAALDFQAIPAVEISEPVYKKTIIEPVESINVYSEEEPIRWRPNDTLYSTQWALNNTGQTIGGVSGVAGADISAEAAWEIEKGHHGVIVAVFDQGIAFNHPDLAANMWDGIGPDGNQTRPGSHGTHVAGTVSAVTNNGLGVAGIAGGSGEGDGVKLMSCSIFHQGANYSLLNIYAADNGAAISQNSWAYSEFDAYNQADLNAIDYFNAEGGGAVLDGGITIFGSGNDNSNRNQYPAYYSGTIAVSATDNRDRKSDFSNYGLWIDISAPGTSIVSTTLNGTYTSESGTSMACPHVSGVAALLISYAYRNNVVLTNHQLKNILLSTADDIYDRNPSYRLQLGTGRVNAHAALLEVQENYLQIDEPQIFMSMPLSSSAINLQWLGNESSDEVMVASSLTPQFGNPVPGTFYAPGHLIEGGGSVIYAGSESSFNHTELTPNTTYYYQAFSYDSRFNYSPGIPTESTTMLDTEITGDIHDQPQATKLFPNYPNPFNPETTISFSLEKQEKITLEVLDISGRHVVTLIEQVLPTGMHQAVWDGRNKAGKEVSGGIYFYRLSTTSRNTTRKMILLK